jgi:NAD(P)H-hydrate epimerase
VAPTKEVDAFKAVSAHQLAIVMRMGVQVVGAAQVFRLSPVGLILDGVIGYSLSGPPRATAAELIRWANGHGAPILALDTPSGFDVTTGTAYTPTIRAAVTMTLALPKAGLRVPAAAPYVDELYLADISVPPQLYAELGLTVEPIFAHEEIVRLQ